jgi:hypothetical protein
MNYQTETATAAAANADAATTATSESERDQLGHAFDSTPPFFKLLSTLRTRRVGLGYRCETGEPEVLEWSSGKTVKQAKGPLAFTSAHAPVALSELEEALICWAACGPNGIALADIPLHGNLSSLLSWAGRTVPGGDSNAAIDLFVVNDRGTHLYRPGEDRSGPIEIRSPEDYGKVLESYRAGLVQVSDRRPDIGWHAAPEDTRSVDMMSPAQYNVNRPGSTWLIPVGDVGLEWFNLLFSCYEWWGTFLAKPEDFSPAGCDIWVKPGFMETGWPIPSFDEMVAFEHASQAGALQQNVRLACEALGLGAWRLGVYSSDMVLGGFPDVAKGLGFNYLVRDAERNPTAVMTATGLPGVKEAVVVPSERFPTAESAVRYVKELRYRPGGPLSQERNYALEHGGPYRPEVMEEVLEHPRAHISAEWVETAVLETVQYIVDTYGCAPAFTNPLHAHTSIQVHHLDVDFYRRFQVSANGGGEPYAVTPQIREHFATWHPGDPDPYAQSEAPG